MSKQFTLDLPNIPVGEPDIALIVRVEASLPKPVLSESDPILYECSYSRLVPSNACVLQEVVMGR